MGKSIAIVAIAYNREKSLERLLYSISEAVIDEGTDLIISIDKSDNSLVEKCAQEFNWLYGEKQVVTHKENLGLKRHILSCGNYLDKYDALIVLEDDLVVSRSFFSYAKYAVDKYYNDNNIAGISLYSFHINPHTGYPFFPAKNEHDAYFVQYAPSWGQVWMKNQWKDFVDWYENNQDDSFSLPHLPINISTWGKQSWLKYHIKYAIENSKFFVYPYFAFSTTNSDVGEHTNVSSTYFQVVLQEGDVEGFKFPLLNDDSIKYDCNFERELKLYGFDDLCVDLNGTKGNRTKRRYWLTTLAEPYKIIKSYKLCYRPIEKNISEKNLGNDIFLYDTKYNARKPEYSRSTKWYLTDTMFMLLRLKDYGFKDLIREILFYTKKKIVK